ncbi:MAG: AsmA-like C-terminal domain-containing protein, partial [Candidatus Methylomirabilales bacterium]
VEPRRAASPRLLLRRGRTTAILRGSVTALGRTPLRGLDPAQELLLDLAAEVPAGHTADLAGDLPPGLEIRGAFRAQGSLAGTPRRLGGRFEVAMEDVQTWRDHWDRGQAVVGLDAGGVHVTGISVSRPGERARGEVHVERDVLRGHVETDGVDLGRVGWLSAASLAGRATGRLELSGTTKEPRVQGRAASPDLAYRGVRFGAARADFAVVGRRGLEVQAAAEGLRLSLGLDLVQDTVTADLAATEADLLPLLRLAGARLDRVAVRGTGRVLLQGPLADLRAGEGQLDFPRLRVVVGGDTWENRAAVRAAWRHHVLTLPPTRIRAGAREVLLQGTLGEGQQADLLVEGEFPLAAVAGLLPGLEARAGAARAALTVRGPLRAPEIRGQAAVQGATIAVPGLQSPLQDVEAAVRLDGLRTAVPSWQGRLAGGVIRGSGEVVREPAGWRMTAAFALENARAEQLLGPLRGKGEVTGRLSATGSLRSAGADREAFWRSLGGNLEVVMREGRLGQHTVLARILSLLNVAQLLSLKIPDLVSSGMPYDRLAADIAIRDGVARTENLVLDAPAMKVNAVGEVNLPDETVDLQVAVKPFQTVDTIITRIPIAGWLLGGKEQSLIVASFHVTGPLKDPEVKPQPVQDVARNVFGIFRRVLELPESLVGPYEHLPPQPVRPQEGQDR